METSLSKSSLFNLQGWEEKEKLQFPLASTMHASVALKDNALEKRAKKTQRDHEN